MVNQSSLMAMLRDPKPNEAVSDIVLKLMVFLAGDESRLERFLALSGLGPIDLRLRYGEQIFQGFLLDHLFQDDGLTSDFCTDAQISAETLMHLRARLPGGEWHGDF